jgi:hypothetical protein
MKPPKISFIGLTTLILILLKVTNYIDWSWWWVLSPLWGSIVILLVLSGVFSIIEKYQ